MDRVAQIIELVAKEFKKTFAQEAQLLLFGSRANNSHALYSDIDLAIVHKHTLNQDKLLDFKNFIDDFPTLYSFDLVDMNEANQMLKQQIQHNSIIL